MSNEMHWGGINGKSLFKALVTDIWMVFAVMVITYIGLGILGNMRYTPSYTSEAVVAVYPLNQMYTLEASSSALETVSAVNEVLNSEMFSTGLRNRLAEPADYYLYSYQLDRTFMLVLSVSSSSPENAFKVLRGALEYFGEISSNLVGDSRLEILTGPDFPLSASNTSRILRLRPLLTLFMGFAAGAFLVLMYAMRKTYKSSSAIQRSYKNVRFFRVTAPASGRHILRKNGRSASATDRETMRKTALEVMQTLRAKKARSVFVTSAAHNEGKTEVAISLARELADSGKSVLLLETDSEKTDFSEHLSMSDILPGHILPMLMQGEAALDGVAAAITDRGIKVLFANNSTHDDFVPYDAGKILEQAEKLVDIILVDGCIWTGSGDERIWSEAADTSLAVCRQDKADFYAIDRMMTDLRENDSEFLGCVLYGF
ncbi:MAG: hypothetical protein IKH57_25075 [Clostridia bacterium]|nr:hypothetical protein [Clostridia bacterium]MBR6860323.1 hypothetical protein [Acidaminococcaceae bacterium]